MLTPSRHRDVKPDSYPQSRRAREDRAATQANGKKPVTCTKCGFVGGNARGCGTAHPTQPPTLELAPREAASSRVVRTPVPIGVPPPRVRRLAPKPEALEERRASIAERQASRATAPKAAEIDDNPNARERWSEGDIETATKEAEADKHIGGELPEPHSSFLITGRVGGLAEVSQIGGFREPEPAPEAELDFATNGDARDTW